MNDGYELHEVRYAYDGVRAVDDFTITLPRGKFYGIVGPNGCGKTTLLDILIGSRNPDTGTVRFAGRVMHEYSRRELARQVALVPQDFAIGFAFTVEEVVLMGRHPYISRFASPSAEDWRIVEDAMDTIGIRHFTTRYVNELSGGEKQRVVVARALAQDTPVLLFDEATSNLDVRYTLHIFNVVRRLVNDEGKTVIAVIQNLNLAAAYCDEILFMKGGRLLKHGPVSRVMKPSTIKEVFEVESEMRMDSYSGSLQVSFRYRSS